MVSGKHRISILSLGPTSNIQHPTSYPSPPPSPSFQEQKAQPRARAHRHHCPEIQKCKPTWTRGWASHVAKDPRGSRLRRGRRPGQPRFSAAWSQSIRAPSRACYCPCVTFCKTHHRLNKNAESGGVEPCECQREVFFTLVSGGGHVWLIWHFSNRMWFKCSWIGIGVGIRIGITIVVTAISSVPGVIISHSA